MRELIRFSVSIELGARDYQSIQDLPFSYTLAHTFDKPKSPEKKLKEFIKRVHVLRGGKGKVRKKALISKLVNTDNPIECKDRITQMVVKTIQVLELRCPS
jgi:trimethylamine:corrinoid methyltransferase-like protein